MGAAALPVTCSTTGIKKNKSRFRNLLSVQDVLVWALFAAVWVAGTVGVTAAICLAGVPIPSRLQPPDLTPAQEAEVDSFAEGFLCLIVPQAAAAAAGLLLPRRHARSRWSLALVAVASAAMAHYTSARMVLVFIAANPGDIAYDILAGGGGVLALGFDLLGLISLLIGGPDY